MQPSNLTISFLLHLTFYLLIFHYKIPKHVVSSSLKILSKNLKMLQLMHNLATFQLYFGSARFASKLSQETKGIERRVLLYNTLTQPPFESVIFLKSCP